MSAEDHLKQIVSIFERVDDPSNVELYGAIYEASLFLRNKSLCTIIISGGQIGVDQEALEAARQLGIRTGGWCPKGWVTSRGPNIRLKTVYHLQEVDEPVPEGYVTRSKKNVDESDATVAFRAHNDGIGTDKTIGYCQSSIWQDYKYPRRRGHFHRPVLILSKSTNPAATQADIDEEIQAFREFIVSNNVQTLNVCGSRSTPPGSLVTKFLMTALQPFLQKV
jgi:hypothetical protein